MNKKLVIVTALVAVFIGVSCKKEKDPQLIENQKVNSWITSVMEEVYLWTSDVPANTWNAQSEASPENYFVSLLSEEDDWSYITDDYDALLADLNGTPVTHGFFPIHGEFTGSDYIFAVVGYVYKNSPAANAGLKRGDIILEINNTKLTRSNYYDLIYEPSITVKMGYADGNTIYETNTTHSLEAVIMDVNPVLAYKVIEKSGKSIGYIAVTEFTSKDNFVSGLEPALVEFTSAGVDDIIVDLRYNLGGSLGSAVWLASALVGTQEMDNESLLTSLQFNELLQPFFENDNSTKYYFEHNTFNLNLDRAYFITSRYSASASELLISGLSPYMDVTTIGELTRGKYVGSSLFPQPTESVDHNYGMLPIMFEYTNALGENVKNGIAANHEVVDDIFAGLSIDDELDPMVAKAIELITGIVSAHTKSAMDYSQFEKLISPQQEQRMRLIKD